MTAPNSDLASRRFVTAAEKVDYVSPWTLEEWLSRSDVVPNQVHNRHDRKTSKSGQRPAG